MKIGIDISQLAYEQTGVANLLRSLVQTMVQNDDQNEYILFYSSLRRPAVNLKLNTENVTLKRFRFPPTFLDLLWNRLHILPVEMLIGDVDVFISSDWTQPPTRKAKKVTILYDLIIYKYPEEMDDRIVKTHKRRLTWVKKECDKILCISEATKRDAKELLRIEEEKLKVVYPGAKLTG